MNTWWKIALRPPIKLSKRRDNNAINLHLEKIPQILRRRTKNPNKASGKYRRVAHLIAKEEQIKRKDATTDREDSTVKKVEVWDSIRRKNWRRLNEKKGKNKENKKNEFQALTWKNETTPRKMRDQLKFATLNVQGINMMGKKARKSRNGWKKRR